MNVFFEPIDAINLYPFGQIRNQKKLRFGYFSVEERWIKYLNQTLQQEIQVTLDPNNAEVIVHGISLLDLRTVQIKPNTNITYKNRPILSFIKATKKESLDNICLLENNLDVLANIKKIIELDFLIIDKKPNCSIFLNENIKIYNPENCVLGTNVTLRNCVLDATKGPIIISDDVEIKDFVVIEGPVIIQSNSKILPNTYLRANTIIGKNCVISGEVKNSIFMSHSNKGHLGFLGDSIIGEYCNLGAGTSTSNLKNNFSNINYLDYHKMEFVDSNLQKLGAFIGDFSMTAVNTVLQAGTTIGVHSNIFGENKYPKHIPSFCWGISNHYQTELWKKTASQLLINKGAGESEINELIGNLELLYKNK